MELEEKKNIGSLFNRIAKNYDRFNHLTSMNIDKTWRRRSTKRLQPVERALDVAIGTGDLAIELLRRKKAKHVVGIDLSTGMMEVGRAKAEKKGFVNDIEWLEASALEMPFEDNSFDLLSCGYGVRNFSDLDKGLSEFCRVLKPGGQLMILEFSYPQNKLVAWFYNFYFRNVMTKSGEMMTNDRAAFNYFYNSVKNFIWGDEMVQHLKDAGFSDVTYKTMSFGISTTYFAKK